MERIRLVHGAGCTVWDATGQAYLDLLAGTWCNVLGYGHPRWIEAVRSQAGKLTHVGASFSTEEVDAALRKLGEILPPTLNRVTLLNTGSEAVELALKMAHAATGADKVTVTERGYYGATTYALSLAEAGRSAPHLPHLASVVRLPAPTCSQCPTGQTWPCRGFSCLDPLRSVIAEQIPVAAVLYEPVMAVAGVIVPPPGYGAQLRDLSTRSGAMLIAEEVTTGMGRTGRWFGFMHDGAVPDILVIGKALGAGLPVAAVVTTQKVEERCRGRVRHVQSHQNDPFSGRIAAAVITILEEEGLVERAARQGAYFLEKLQEFLEFPSIRETRGQGLMLGIQLGPDQAQAGSSIARSLLEDGFIVDYRPQTATFRLFPPYVITVEEIERFLACFRRAMIRGGKGT
ncbi:MAG: aspartate aminotransferase family protein [Anaerolineae bacterium]